MEAYETDDDYTFREMSQIRDWFNEEIGTDSEVNPSASGEPNEYYIMFYDLTAREVTKLQEFEREFRKRNK